MPRVDASACAATTAQAHDAVRPADIIWVIDNSRSMKEEERRIQTNLNAFSTDIAGSGIDYHVIVIAQRSHVDIPPPLAGSGRLRQIDRHVSSSNALERVIETYPQWSDFLRPDSVRHIVAVTDDESDWSASKFETAIAALASPGFPNGFTFHAIVAPDPPWASGACFLLSAARGDTYIELQQAHNGVFYSLCETDWTPVFTALSSSVIEQSALPCSYDLPAPPAGDTLDHDRVNVVYMPSTGSARTIPRVSAASAGRTDDGWYYDDPSAPTQINVCPTTCQTFEADTGGQVDIALGCATIVD